MTGEQLAILDDDEQAMAKRNVNIMGDVADQDLDAVLGRLAEARLVVREAAKLRSLIAGGELVEKEPSHHILLLLDTVDARLKDMVDGRTK